MKIEIDVVKSLPAGYKILKVIDVPDFIAVGNFYIIVSVKLFIFNGKYAVYIK